VGFKSFLLSIQVYMPMPLYVLEEEDSSTSKLDYVFVEAGCSCKNNKR